MSFSIVIVIFFRKKRVFWTLVQQISFFILSFFLANFGTGRRTPFFKLYSLSLNTEINFISFIGVFYKKHTPDTCHEYVE